MRSDARLQIAIDYNAALANAVAGLAALPDSFWQEACPSIPALQQQALEDVAEERARRSAASERLT